jgi:hypothetical protein
LKGCILVFQVQCISLVHCIQRKMCFSCIQETQILSIDLNTSQCNQICALPHETLSSFWVYMPRFMAWLSIIFIPHFSRMMNTSRILVLFFNTCTILLLYRLFLCTSIIVLDKHKHDSQLQNVLYRWTSVTPWWTGFAGFPYFLYIIIIIIILLIIRVIKAKF